MEPVKLLSGVQLFVTPWTRAYQAPPFTEFSRQEYWSGLPFPSPGDLLNPRIRPKFATLQADALPSEPLGNPFRSGKDWLFSLSNYFEGLSHCFLRQLYYFTVSPPNRFQFLYILPNTSNFLCFLFGWLVLLFFFFFFRMSIIFKVCLQLNN